METPWNLYDLGLGPSAEQLCHLPDGNAMKAVSLKQQGDGVRSDRRALRPEGKGLGLPTCFRRSLLLIGGGRIGIAADR